MQDSNLESYEECRKLEAIKVQQQQQHESATQYYLSQNIALPCPALQLISTCP
jgi:hypothetical protein